MNPFDARGGKVGLSMYPKYGRLSQCWLECAVRDQQQQQPIYHATNCLKNLNTCSAEYKISTTNSIVKPLLYFTDRNIRRVYLWMYEYVQGLTCIDLRSYL